MDILSEIREIFSGEHDYIKSKNFYFENHQCPVGGGIVKVMMDFKIQTEISDKIIKIGQCPVCKTAYYHEDYESKSK